MSLRSRALAALAIGLAAVVVAAVTLPRWGGESASVGTPERSVPSSSVATTRPPPTAPAVPPSVNPGLPTPPPIDAARAFADPCVVLTAGVLDAVGVDAEPERNGKWGCAAEVGKRAATVDLQVPESDDPGVTSWAYEQGHDERPKPVGQLAYVFELRLGDRTVITVFCPDVIVSLSLPVDDVEEELVVEWLAELE